VAESVLGEITCDVPISYGQRYARAGGNLIYVLDEAAATELLTHRVSAEAKGAQIVDARGAP
jgi:hypothetical protein